MGERCYSTLVCANRDQVLFEKLGYRLDDSRALTVDGYEIRGAVVMVDEQANGGHYDEITALAGAPFLVCNGSCLGAYGDHLIVSDGAEWCYVESLHESSYPAVRAEFDGAVRSQEVEEARKYWRIYAAAVAAIKRAALRNKTSASNRS